MFSARCSAYYDCTVFSIPVNSMMNCLATHSRRDDNLLRSVIFPFRDPDFVQSKDQVATIALHLPFRWLFQEEILAILAGVRLLEACWPSLRNRLYGVLRMNPPTREWQLYHIYWKTIMENVCSRRWLGLFGLMLNPGEDICIKVFRQGIMTTTLFRWYQSIFQGSSQQPVDNWMLPPGD
jgi:hypothetical protein